MSRKRPILPKASASIAGGFPPDREWANWFKDAHDNLQDQIDGLNSAVGNITGLNTTVAGLPRKIVPAGTGFFHITSNAQDADAKLVAETDLSFTDITTGNATSSQHGLLPKLSGVSTDVLKGDGTFGASAGGGAFVKIGKVVTTGSQSTIAFNSISGAYTDLKLVISGRDTNAGVATAALRIGFNGDTTAGNYTSANYVEGFGGAATSGTQASSTAGAYIGYIPGTASSAQAVGVVELTIPNYAGTVFHKIMQGQNYEDLANGSSLATDVRGSKWASTAAITSILLTAGGTAFVDGTTATLYGLG